MIIQALHIFKSYISLMRNELKDNQFSVYTLDLIKKLITNTFSFLEFSDWQHLVFVAVFGDGKSKL